MDERPDEPGGNPAQPNSACFEDGKILADDSHIAFVEVAERAGRRVTLDLCADVPADIPAFLDCYLSDAGQGAASLGECRSVADDEYLRVVGYSFGCAPVAYGGDCDRLGRARSVSARSTP